LLMPSAQVAPEQEGVVGAVWNGLNVFGDNVANAVTDAVNAVGEAFESLTGEELEAREVENRKLMSRTLTSKRILATATSEEDVDMAQRYMLGDEDNPDFSRAEWNRLMHEKPSKQTVHKAFKVLDDLAAAKREEELAARKMKKYNTRVLMRVFKHDGDKSTPYFVNVVNSVYLDDLRKIISERLGVTGRFKVLWLNLGGETIELNSQRIFSKYADTMWCTRPWELHVQPEGKAMVKSLALHDYTKTLFVKYDINNNKQIDKAELKKMLLELDRDKIQCSEKLLEKFVDVEFPDLDKDNSGGLTLNEFTDYVTSMTRFMRDELLTLANHHNALEVTSSRAMEQTLPAVLIDEPPEGQEYIDVAPRNQYGISLRIPRGTFEPGTSVSISTVAPNSIGHLQDGAKAQRGEFVFTPIVSIHIPGLEPGAKPTVAKPIDRANVQYFPKPITLIMPHCFDYNEEDSVVALGAPHGCNQWEGIHEVVSAADTEVDVLKLLKGKEEGTMEMQIKYAGIFAGFTHPDIDDVCRVRAYIFALPELPRDDSSALRVHLCPETPDQVEQMRLSETCEWGLTAEIGKSKVMKLCQGTRLQLTYLKQTVNLLWMGAHVSAEFTVPRSDDRGEEPPEGGWPPDGDKREKLKGSVHIDAIESDMGTRAKRLPAVKKRAGFANWTPPNEILFETWLQAEVRPDPPHNVKVVRDQYEFTVSWKAPLALDGDGDGIVSEITHYAIEIATNGPSGTLYPWMQVWAGQAHTPPDFHELLQEEYKKRGKSTKDAPQAVEPKKLLSQVSEKRLEEKAKSGAAPAVPAGENTQKERGKKKKGDAKKVSKPAKAKARRASVAMAETPTYSYTILADPELFGRLRVRCWNETIPQPSKYSEEVKLERYIGDLLTAKTSYQNDLEAIRRHYYVDLHEGQETRIGPPASTGEWGGDKMPPPPQPLKKGVRIPPVPYDYPAIARTPEILKCADELVGIYRLFGVHGGGAGTLFGLRIEHIIQAAAGSPLMDGKSTPRRTAATLNEPLVLLCEVAYNDKLLPGCDTVVVMKDAWNWVDEKVAGIIRQIVDTAVPNYELCKKHSHLTELLYVLTQIYEMMQQCEKDKTIACHLTDSEYSPALKKKLEHEMAEQMADILWKLSNELIEMVIDVEDGDADDGKVIKNDSLASSVGQLARLELIAQNKRQHQGQAQGENCVVS